jgi:hypothetical protein
MNIAHKPMATFRLAGAFGCCVVCTGILKKSC